MEQWQDFTEGTWMSQVDVRDFIQKNYTPYEGDSDFLAGPTERTKMVWNTVLKLLEED